MSKSKAAKIGLAEKIVDFLENNDKAFGFSEDIPGQANKEQWVATVTSVLLDSPKELLAGLQELRDQLPGAELKREAGIFISEIVKHIEPPGHHSPAANITSIKDRLQEAAKASAELSAKTEPKPFVRASASVEIGG